MSESSEESQKWERIMAEGMDEHSPLTTAAVQLHEMYTSLTNAGFSDKNAIYLTSKMMTTGTIQDDDDEKDTE